MLQVEPRIAKIKRDPKSEKIEIGLEASYKEGVLAGQYDSKADPHPDFVNAIRSLAPVVIDICEQKGAKPEEVDVRSLSFSFPGDGGKAVIITAVRTLASGSSLLLNTPLRFIDADDESADQRMLTKKAVEKIDLVITEATAFLEGTKRGQVEMFEGGEKKAEEPQPVNIYALKAALILSRLRGEVEDSAFDEELDEIEENDPRLTAVLGRAPIELLAEIPAEEAAELMATCHAVMATPGNGKSLLTEADADRFDWLATKIAEHGATVAPYHADIELVEDSVIEGAITKLNEEEWLQLSGDDLRAIMETESEEDDSENDDSENPEPDDEPIQGDWDQGPDAWRDAEKEAAATVPADDDSDGDDDPLPF